MRCLLLPLLIAAACDGGTEPGGYPHPPIGDPDAGDGTCNLGAFQIAAPRPDLHYAPSMDVNVYESELQGELTLTMVDDLGASYQWTSWNPQPNPTDAGEWWSLDKYHYELQPGHRYTLTVSHCADVQTVVFFTSAS